MSDDRQTGAGGTAPRAADGHGSTLRVLTIAEAAAYLRISRGSAYEAARRGDLPTLKLGRRLLVPRVALEMLLERTAGATREVSDEQ